MVAEVLMAIMNNPIARRLIRFLARNFRLPKEGVSVKVHGLTMYGHTLDRLIVLYLWKFSMLESFETKLMRQLVKKGMVAVDVGANIGYYTLLLSDLVGPNGKVVAFEADPDNYAFLTKNIYANKRKNIEHVQVAVSNAAGSIDLFICEEHKGDTRIYDSRDNRKSLKIDAMTLDHFFRENPRVDLIKMDVQGAEFLVLQGMEKIINHNPDLILIAEFWPEGLQKCGVVPEKFLQRLIDHGLRLYLINEQAERVEETIVEHLMKICMGSKYVNLMLQRKIYRP